MHILQKIIFNILRLTKDSLLLIQIKYVYIYTIKTNTTVFQINQFLLEFLTSLLIESIFILFYKLIN